MTSAGQPGLPWRRLVTPLGLCLLLRLVFLGLSYHAPEDVYGSRTREAGIRAVHMLVGKPFFTNQAADERFFNLRANHHSPVEFEDLDIDFARSTPMSYLGDDLGYTFLVAGVWFLTGSHRFISVRLLQIALDVGVCLLLAMTLWRLTGDRRWAIGVAWTYALFPPFAYYAMVPTPYIFVVWAIVAGMYFSAAVITWSRMGLWQLTSCVGFGLLFFAFQTLRSSVIFLPVAISLGILVQRLSFWRRVLPTALLLVTFFGANALYRGNLSAQFPGMPLSHVVWHAVWVGFGEDPDNPAGITYSDYSGFERVRQTDPSVPILSSRYEEILRDASVELVRAHPLWFAGLMARRLLALSVSRQMYLNLPLFHNSEQLVFRLGSAGVSLLLFALTYAFLLAHRRELAADRRRWVLFLPWYVLASALPFLAIMMEVNIPILLVQVIFLAPALLWLGDKLRRLRGPTTTSTSAG